MRKMLEISPKAVIAEVRREFGKANLDISRMDVTYLYGVITLYGWIGRIKGDRSPFSVQDRVKKVIEQVKRIHGVDDVVVYARIREY